MTDNRTWGNIVYPTRAEMLADIVAEWFEPIDLGCADNVTDLEMAEELLTHWPSETVAAAELAPYVATFRAVLDVDNRWDYGGLPTASDL